MSVMYVGGVPSPQKIRVISLGAFRRRLTLDEKVALQVSTDPVVQVLLADFNASTFVDLDFSGLLEGLAYLKEAKILTDDRVTEILKDGTEEEKP